MNPKRTIRILAGFDLAITGLLALPWTAVLFLDGISRLDGLAGFGTSEAVIGALALFFINLAGVLGVLWAAVRLRAPSLELARMDAIGRVVVSALIIFAIAEGATPVLGVFVVSELIGAGVQAVLR